ncbi:MAG: hypothetical protein BEN18_10400 [Epulopiscium sp. Nuni2H_MBin001]|nr:MAG: hypothetical protein BEN18_10400 [Epulopiscium sp. Nuni2H_MBin001]
MLNKNKALKVAVGTMVSGLVLYGVGIRCYTYAETIDEYYKLESFQNLSIDTSQININIIEADEFALEINNLDSTGYVNVENKNGTLEIEGAATKSRIQIGIFSMFLNQNKITPDITLYVPTGSYFQTVDIDVSGDLNIGNLYGNQIGMDMGLGDAYINTIHADQFTLEGSSGDFIIDSLLADYVELYMSSGDVDINTLKAQECIIEGSIGDLIEQVTQTRDFSRE